VADGAVTVEVEAGGCTSALLPVDVPEFGFVNVYGTDVTAAKERERLARENERLLLNILPEPIANRLRSGEPVIADRFDDVTLLFADIVGFTVLSASEDWVRVLIREPDDLPLSGHVATVEVSAINRFPDDNPNPVLRVDDDGRDRGCGGVG